MRKHTQNFYIDAISFICMIFLLFTGTIIKYILPPGSHGESLWTMSRHQWGDIHFWIAVVFVAAITLHLILHLPWIKASFFRLSTNKEPADC